MRRAAAPARRASSAVTGGLPPGRTRSGAFRTEGTAAKTRMIMNKKNRVETVEIDDLNALPDLLDGRHHVIPIVTGGDEVAEETDVPEILPILTNTT